MSEPLLTESTAFPHAPESNESGRTIRAPDIADRRTRETPRERRSSESRSTSDEPPVFTERILLVDDEPHVLTGYQRHLRNVFDLVLAEGGPAALASLGSQGPFAVVVSDIRMPEVSGLQLLAHVRQHHPDTIRIVLTGNADQKTAVDAVNDGRIFRFLNKPCSPETLRTAIEDGIRQHRLIRGERDLLSRTLSASVALMTEVLSLSSPLAFGRAMRVKGVVHRLCEALGEKSAWDIEIAAMLSQIGCIALPESLLRKLNDGVPLDQAEADLWIGHPKVGAELVGRIPRLEGVAKMIAHQRTRFDILVGDERPDLDDHQRRGAAILKVALDQDAVAVRSGFAEAVRTITGDRSGRYDPEVGRALAALVGERFEIRAIDLAGLEVGMVLEDHLQSVAGGILVPKGQEVTAALLKRLRSFGDPDRFIRQPFRVRVLGGAPSSAA